MLDELNRLLVEVGPGGLALGHLEAALVGPEK